MLVGATSLVAAEGDFDWVSQLERKETATVRDLVVIVSRSYRDRAGQHTTEQWRDCFVKLGWLSSNAQFDDPCTRGHLGRLIAGRLNLRSDSMLALFGPSERYGFREIVKLDFIRGGTPNQHVSGSVLMTAQSRATAHVQSGGESALADYKAWTTKKLKEGFGE